MKTDTEIHTFAHCKACFERGQTMRMEAGMSTTGLVIACKKHGLIAHFSPGRAGGTAEPWSSVSLLSGRDAQVMTEKLTDEEREWLDECNRDGLEYKCLTLIDALTAAHEQALNERDAAHSALETLTVENERLRAELDAFDRERRDAGDARMAAEARLAEATALLLQALADDEPRQITGFTDETRDRIDAFLANQPAAPNAAERGRALEAMGAEAVTALVFDDEPDPRLFG